MRLHNLGSVIRFEFMRTVTKPRFWAISVGLPLIMGAIITLVTASSSSLDRSVDRAHEARFGFTYTDASGLIDEASAAKLGGRPIADPEQGRADVQEMVSEAHFTYPKDPTTQPVQVYGQDVGLIESGRYAAVAGDLLAQSVALRIGDPLLAKLATSQPDTTVTTYANGVAHNGYAAAVAPGMFLVLFYLAILLLGNQMLSVTLEEKENRVSEMILTTMNATTLIVGKVIALIAVGIVQTAVFLIPAMTLAALAPPSSDPPPSALADLTIDPGRMVVGFLLFLGGFALFTGLLVAIGAIMPTVREAGPAFGAVVMAMLIPLYAGTMIVADPHGWGSQVFTYVPLTAPVTALLRNAIGGLDWWETLLVLVDLFAFAALFLWAGVRLFKTGSVAYGTRVNIRKALAAAGTR